eukprot:TRINITY_DN7047_c0_g1_i1.p1 TRINITY_DN7047_c0_g1~~TRINITY_DN7047_c0_g1_i1.p1  ORF type:complete len:149 (+),score=20.70 TRINITY_DN7047_c0_g1_i1:50-496(+)
MSYGVVPEPTALPNYSAVVPAGVVTEPTALPNYGAVVPAAVPAYGAPAYAGYPPATPYTPPVYTTDGNSFAQSQPPQYWHGAVPYAPRQFEAPQEALYGPQKPPYPVGVYTYPSEPYMRYMPGEEAKPFRPFCRAHVSKAHRGVFGHL